MRLLPLVLVALNPLQALVPVGELGVFLQFLGVWVLLLLSYAQIGLVSLMGLLGCNVAWGLCQAQVSVFFFFVFF